LCKLILDFSTDSIEVEYKNNNKKQQAQQAKPLEKPRFKDFLPI
jgi:hypothetical protein